MAQPGGQALVTEYALPPGRRELVTKLIRQLLHNLATRVAAGNAAQRIHLISTLDKPDKLAFRQEVANLTTTPGLSVMEVFSQVLSRVVQHLRELRLLTAVGQDEWEFTRILLNILTEPDADAVRAEETSKIVDRTLKVIEMTLGGRDKLPRQDALMADHRAAVAGLVDQLRLGEIDASDAVSLVSAETTWLLSQLRADKTTVLREMPAMDTDVLDQLEAIEKSRDAYRAQQAAERKE